MIGSIRRVRWLVAGLAALAGAAPCVAQSGGASAGIDASVLARDVDVLAADSMRGPTPSRQLDRTIAYLAGQFRAIGLTPGLPERGDTAWTQRYQLPGQLQVDYKTAALMFVSLPFADSVGVLLEQGYSPWHPREHLTFADGARFLSPIMPAPLQRLESQFKPTIVIAGPQTVASATAAADPARIMLYVPEAGADSAKTQAITQALMAGSRGVVIVSATDSVKFAEQIRSGAARPAAFADAYLPLSEDRSWVAEVRGETIRRTLALNGADLSALQAARTPVAKKLSFLLVRLWRELPEDKVNTGTMAPNVVATLPGRDPALQRQWIVITAPIDQAAPGDAPNTLGAAGLLALARAFAASDARPPCPMVFVATTGSGTDFAGTRSFATLARDQSRALMAVSLDLNGQSSTDSMAIDGLRDLAFKPSSSPSVVSALYPDLKMTLVDTGSVLSVTSNPGIFSNNWIPVISFRNAGRPASTSASAESSARLLRMAFHTIGALANANVKDWPQWNAAAKRTLISRPTP